MGIKIHTAVAHDVNPSCRDGVRVFELARELKVPVMVHTGAGIPFANPLNLILITQSFPDVSIIIAHCGMMILAGETYNVMKDYNNLYADITWTSGFVIREWIHELGPHQFMSEQTMLTIAELNWPKYGPVN